MVINVKKVVIFNIRKFQQPVCPQIMITFSRSLEARGCWASEKSDQPTIFVHSFENDQLLGFDRREFEHMQIPSTLRHVERVKKGTNQQFW